MSAAGAAGAAPPAAGGAGSGEGKAYFLAGRDRLAMLPDASEPDLSALLLDRHYGYRASVSVLSSEVERTFEVRVPGGQRYIFKSSSRAHAVESFRFQAAVLDGLRGVPGVIAPHIVPTLSGELMFDQGDVGGYLQSRIGGAPLHEEPRSQVLLYDVGAALARINVAMAGIDAPAARRPVLWNLSCWPWLAELERYLPVGETLRQVCFAMAQYREHVLPRIGALQWQVTHNDPSPFNMIKADDGIAFIDFGDGGWNPRLQDLAIAAAHFATQEDTPLGGAEYVNTWRSHLFPADAPYIMKNVHRAERGLSILSALDGPAAEVAVRAAALLGRP
ncbi:MAG: phosphotransferase [Novosphingobium sp.]